MTCGPTVERAALKHDFNIVLQFVSRCVYLGCRGNQFIRVLVRRNVRQYHEAKSMASEHCPDGEWHLALGDRPVILADKSFCNFCFNQQVIFTENVKRTMFLWQNEKKLI